MASNKKIKASSPIVNAKRSISHIGISAMKQILEQQFALYGVYQANSSTLKMRCPMPWHQDNTPSFTWNFKDGYCICFGCRSYYTDFNRFMRDAKGMLPADSINLIHEFSSRLFTDKDTKELDAHYNHIEAMRVLSAVFNEVMCGCLNPKINEERYTDALVRAVQPALDWLFGTRQHKPEYASMLPYGIKPSDALQETMVQETVGKTGDAIFASTGKLPTKEWRTAIEQRAKNMFLVENIDSSWCYSIAFTYGVSTTEPSCFKLRRPSQDKVIVMTPRWDKTEKNTGSDAPIGFFGLYSPSSLGTSFKDGNVNLHIVEGENSCITVMERLMEEGFSGTQVVAGGGGAVDVRVVSDAGFKKAWVIGDSDEGGASFAKHCLEKSGEVDVSIFDAWDKFKPDSIQGDKPDEFVLRAGIQRFYSEALKPDKFAANYLTAVAWAVERFEKERTGKSLAESCNIAGQLGKCVLNPANRSYFVREIADRLGIEQGPIYNAITLTQDTPEKYVSHWKQQLEQDNLVLYTENKGRGQVLHLWNTAAKKEIELATCDGQAMSKGLAVVYGRFYTDYVKKHIGIPRFLAIPEGSDMSNIEEETTNTKKLYILLEFSVEGMLLGTMRKCEMDIYGQGQFRLADPENPGEYAYYFVNGDDIYKGTYDAVCTTGLNWKTLRGPRDGHYLFRVVSTKWSKEVTDVNDLMQGNAVTKQDLRDGMGTIIKALENWNFRSEKLDARFVAAHLMASSVPCAFDNKVVMSIVGDIGSGKSTLLSLFGKGKASKLQLLEMSNMYLSYSSASIYQANDSCSLLIALDEYEDTKNAKDAKGRAVSDLQNHFKGMLNEGGATVSRGSGDPDKPGREYRLFGFLVTSSVLRSADPADDSRRIYIQTRKIVSHSSPEITVFKTITEKEYHKVRRMLTIGTIHFAEDLRKAAIEIKEELNHPDFLSERTYKASKRFLDCLIPALAVMLVSGEDWKTFVKDFCDERAKQGDFEADAQPSAAADLRDAVLYTPAISMVSNGKSKIRLVDVIAGNEDDWGILNSCGSGAYIMPDKELLVINWLTAMAKGGLLDTAQYPTTNAKNLKHQFDQDPKAIRPEDMPKLKVAEFVTRCKDCWRPDIFSAYDLSEMIAKFKASKQEGTVVTEGELPPAWSTKNGNSGNIN